MKSQSRLFRLTHVAWLTAMLLFAFNQVVAQCPPGNVDLSSQAQVNQFLVDYPNCTQITGDLKITGNITDLSPLNGLTHITRNLVIAGTTLTDINGLTGLISIGNVLQIGGENAPENPQLQNINGFNNLTSLGGGLVIIKNPSLTSITGFNALVQVGGAFDVRQNANLTTIEGLNNLAIIGGYTYINDTKAASIAGFSNLQSIGSFLILDNNANLINTAFLNNLTSTGGGVGIRNNAQLQNLNGLSNLTSVGSKVLLILNNTVLSDISALQNVNPATISEQGLIIQNNPALAVCNLPNFCTYLANEAITHPRIISGNLANCLDEAAVIAACSLSACPPGNVVIATQAQADQFIIAYPNCTQIDGYLAIGNEVTNLNALSNIITITGSLDAGNATMLTDLSGLSNLTTIGQDALIANSALTDLNGLSSLTNIVGWFIIRNNASLTNINGLGALTNIGGYLNIRDNASLTSVNGLVALTNVGGYLQLSNNAALTGINGFSSLTNVGGEGLAIINNGALTNVDGFSSLTSITGLLSISDNASLTNVNGLGALVNIGGFLQFVNNAALTNLNGLSSLTNVGGEGVSIVNNAALTNVDGFSSLTTITGHLNFRDNASLTSVNGFSTLTNIGSYLRFNNNDQLQSLNGLQNLTSIDGALIIQNNDQLTDISAVANIDYTTISFDSSYNAALSITDNTLLSVCNLPNICAYISNDAGTHPRNITGNLANCLDEAAVVVACSTPDCPAGPVVFSTQAEVDQFLTTYPNCTEIAGNLFIGVNSGISDITNLAPLHNLTHIGGWLAVYTTSLTNLNGLHHLTSISHDIDIRANSNLIDVSALQNTTFTPFDGFGLTIINNPALAVCNLSNFCAYIENPASTHPRVISGNLANCLDEAAVVAACVTGIDMIDASLFSIYPNPVNDIVNIVYDKPVTQVSVINMLGQTVLQKDMNTTHASVDLTTLPSGGYFIHILVDDAFSTVRVIKQ